MGSSRVAASTVKHEVGRFEQRCCLVAHARACPRIPARQGMCQDAPMRRFIKGMGFVILGLAMLHVTLWLAFYSGSDRASALVRELNKRILNPVMLRYAGRKGFYAAALHHVGRSSGKLYATPVVANPAKGGFIIPLTYGEGVDWLKNIQAAGSARLAVDGSVVVVDRPEIITAAQAAPFLPAGRKRLLDWQGATTYLRLDSVHQERD